MCRVWTLICNARDLYVFRNETKQPKADFFLRGVPILSIKRIVAWPRDSSLVFLSSMELLAASMELLAASVFSCSRVKNCQPCFRFKCRWRAAGGVSLWHVRKLMKSVMLREFILFQEGRLAALHLPNSSSCATSFSLRYATSFSLPRSSYSLHQSSPAAHESSIVRVTPCLFVTCAKISQTLNP